MFWNLCATLESSKSLPQHSRRSATNLSRSPERYMNDETRHILETRTHFGSAMRRIREEQEMNREEANRLERKKLTSHAL